MQSKFTPRPVFLTFLQEIVLPFPHPLIFFRQTDGVSQIAKNAVRYIAFLLQIRSYSGQFFVDMFGELVAEVLLQVGSSHSMSKGPEKEKINISHFIQNRICLLVGAVFIGEELLLSFPMFLDRFAIL